MITWLSHGTSENKEKMHTSENNKKRTSDSGKICMYVVRQYLKRIRGEGVQWWGGGAHPKQVLDGAVGVVEAGAEGALHLLACEPHRHHLVERLHVRLARHQRAFRRRHAHVRRRRRRHALSRRRRRRGRRHRRRWLRRGRGSGDGGDDGGGGDGGRDGGGVAGRGRRGGGVRRWRGDRRRLRLRLQRAKYQHHVFCRQHNNRNTGKRKWLIHWARRLRLSITTHS